MKKLNVMLACMLALSLSGCGTIADLSVTPYGIAADKGVEAAKAWCIQRDVDLASAKAASSLFGRFVDVPLKVVAAPVEALAGPVLHGTTAVRDAQCEYLIGQ